MGIKKNVFVFPCGSEIGLEINRSLAYSTHFEMYGGSSVDDHGRFVYKNYIGELPTVDALNFISEINKVVEKYNIDFIIPSHDSVVLKLAENHSKIKAIVVTSSVETCRICRSKKEIYKVFKDIVPTPKIYDDKENEMNFPVFLKPNIGQGAKGTHKAHTKEEFEFYLKQDSTLLILEYLPGKEYTIDCFTNRKGDLLFAEGRERIRICNGISVNSKWVRSHEFHQIAEAINKRLSFQGAWFCQVKERENGELVLMEIAPRIAGTMGLFRATGINFTQLSLYDSMGIDINILNNSLDIEIDRALFARYSVPNSYSCVYIDLDDTIVINDKINPLVMMFLYQARHAGKRIVLLSKGKGDINETLRRHAISDLLFDDIVQLKSGNNKRDYMKNRDSIFIDDSFAERKEVSDALGIPVYGVDAIESLLSWKV